MNEEVVRYERLRPAQIVARREACPVAYLPIGTIEWHGEHNPVGLDTSSAPAKSGGWFSHPCTTASTGNKL